MKAREERMARKTLLIAVVGTKKSGKTAMVEYLISGLTKRGFSVAAVKHVHHSRFSIDSEGKDSWRFAKAGARQVAIVSPDEIAIIEKTEEGERYLDRVLETLKGMEPDVIVLEGFKSVLGDRPIHRIVMAHDTYELEELNRDMSGPVLAYSLLEQTDTKHLGPIPVVKFPEDGEALLDQITRLSTGILTGRRGNS